MQAAQLWQLCRLSADCLPTCELQALKARRTHLEVQVPCHLSHGTSHKPCMQLIHSRKIWSAVMEVYQIKYLSLVRY